MKDSRIWEISHPENQITTSPGGEAVITKVEKIIYAFTRKQFDFLTRRLRNSGVGYKTRRVPRGKQPAV